MAENENGEEKTEQATSKKRKDARKKGQVLKSQDITIVCSLFVTFFILRIMAPMIFTELSNCIGHYCSIAGSGIGEMSVIGEDRFVRSLMVDLSKTYLISCGVLLAAALVISFIVTGIQTKFLVNFEQMKFNLGKMNPLNGIKRMFSLKGVFELAKSLLKMIILVAVVYNEIKSRLPEFTNLMFIEPQKGILYVAETVFSIVMTIGLVFVVVAVADFMFQRYTFENDLKMTKQEVKDEFKQMDGDPKVKGKRRAIQQQMAMQRMMQEVPSADVIIRNPTHFAVALKYDPEKSGAPIVLAKGKDMVALRIVDIAAEHDVPSVENKPLARSLYDSVEIGREIPEEFYGAVAEVLTFVYKLKNKSLPRKQKPAAGTPFNY